VFFSSSNAVKAFFNQEEVKENIKYAAIGNETAKTLTEFVKPNFIGEGQTENVGAQFNSVLEKSDTVLFPISDKSNRTIQNTLDTSQIEEVVVYETKESPTNVEDCDAYVFTSPSNVNAFFKVNELPDVAKVIAIGKATQQALLNLDIENSQLSWDYNSLALWDSI